MLSRKVLKLQKRCYATERATEAYARIACDVWVPRFREELSAEEAERFADPGGFFQLMLEVTGVRMVRTACDEMIAADRAWRRACRELTWTCRRRDKAVKALYRSVVKVRKKYKAHLDAKAEKAFLFVSGETPRQPLELSRWADAIEEGLRAPEFPIAARRLDAEHHADELAERRTALDEAADAIAFAEAEKTKTQRDRQLAIEACEQIHLRCSQYVEAALRFVGREDLAYEIRGVRRPGRPRKGENLPSRGAESFSWLPRALRRARKSFSRRLRAS